MYNWHNFKVHTCTYTFNKIKVFKKMSDAETCMRLCKQRLSRQCFYNTRTELYQITSLKSPHIGKVLTWQVAN